MSKKEREPFIGAIVQVVEGKSVGAAIVTGLGTPGVVNVKLLEDMGEVRNLAVVEAEAAAAAHNRAGVGFAVNRHWRWPR